MQDINLLKQALPYFRKFKGSLFVIKFGGEPLRSQETLDSLAEDISFLHSIGIRVVLVHGGGPQVTDVEKLIGAESRFVAGRRVTDEKSLEALKMVLAGKINIELVARLRKYGIPAVGLTGVSANIITATRRPPTKVTGSNEVVDFGLVGDIEKIETGTISQLLDQGLLPIVCPLSADREGNILNVNADVVASRLAASLKAEKLLLLTDKMGVMTNVDDPTTLISQLTADQGRDAIRQGIIKGGMIPKVEEALRSLQNGVQQVHILSAVEPHTLLVEIFTETGCGTMLTH
jgi:acetylglutamate kinase